MNAFQGTGFVVALVGFAIAIPEQLGGFTGATNTILDVNPAPLNRAGLPPLGWKTHLSVAVMVSIETFILPHLFTRYMTSRRANTASGPPSSAPSRSSSRWGPAVLLWFWGLGFRLRVPPRHSAVRRADRRHDRRLARHQSARRRTHRRIPDALRGLLATSALTPAGTSLRRRPPRAPRPRG